MADAVNSFSDIFASLAVYFGLKAKKIEVRDPEGETLNEIISRAS